MVVSISERTVVDIHPIFVLRLVEIALASSRLSHAFTVLHKQILIVIRPLFQWQRDFILMLHEVIFHLVFICQSSVGQIPMQIEVSTRDLRNGKPKMRDVVLTFRFAIYIVGIPHVVPAVLVLVEDIVHALLIRHHESMIVRIFISHRIDTHGGHMVVQHFEASVFVARRKNQVPIMIENQRVGFQIRRL